MFALNQIKKQVRRRDVRRTAEPPDVAGPGLRMHDGNRQVEGGGKVLYIYIYMCFINLYNLILFSCAVVIAC